MLIHRSDKGRTFYTEIPRVIKRGMVKLFIADSYTTRYELQIATILSLYIVPELGSISV